MASNIVFDGTKGISLPSFTTTEKNAIVSPATGAVVYDSTLKQESLYNGSAWVNVNASGNSAITSGTAQASTSGTSIDFTDIPSWAKRITVMFNGVSLSSSANYLIQLGSSGGIENTGYVSTSATVTGAPVVASNTTGFIVRQASSTGASVANGHMIITNVSGNTWISSHSVTVSATASSAGGGSKTISNVLTTIRITSDSTDTFDAGSINIFYE